MPSNLKDRQTISYLDISSSAISKTFPPRNNHFRINKQKQNSNAATFQRSTKANQDLSPDELELLIESLTESSDGPVDVHQTLVLLIFTDTLLKHLLDHLGLLKLILSLVPALLNLSSLLADNKWCLT